MLVLECSYDNSTKNENHLIPSEAGRIARKCNAKKLVITHFYPLERDARLEETKKVFPETVMAEDLMEIAI